MKIDMSSTAQARIDTILESLYTQFDLEELMPDELVEALIDLGVDLVVSDEFDMPNARERLLEYCVRRVGTRCTPDESDEFRG